MIGDRYLMIVNTISVGVGDGVTLGVALGVAVAVAVGVGVAVGVVVGVGVGVANSPLTPEQPSNQITFNVAMNTGAFLIAPVSHDATLYANRGVSSAAIIDSPHPRFYNRSN